jgi:hypothetical protein
MNQHQTRRCAGCGRVPLILFTIVDGRILQARCGCLCSSATVDSSGRAARARAGEAPAKLAAINYSALTPRKR